jgi:DNA-binding IclR family transcriptional regulator
MSGTPPKRMPAESLEGSQTLVKGLTVLELVAERQKHHGVGLGQLTRELGWNKSTTHRFLSTLVSLGYAQQNPQNGFYRLGLKALQLGAAYSRDFNLQAAAASTLSDLVERTEFGSSLVILDAATREVVYIDRVDSTHPLRMHVDIGMRFPWNCTAAGKAIVAYLPDAEARLLLSGKLLGRTSASIQNASTLRGYFDEVRATGFATDDGENSDGVRCIAAPIFAPSGRPTAAISISGYIGQMPRERLSKLGDIVCKAAGNVSRLLGHQEKIADAQV